MCYFSQNSALFNHDWLLTTFHFHDVCYAFRNWARTTRKVSSDSACSAFDREPQLDSYLNSALDAGLQRRVSKVSNPHMSYAHMKNCVNCLKLLLSTSFKERHVSSLQEIQRWGFMIRRIIKQRRSSGTQHVTPTKRR
jgi:hypothetical protein